MSDHQAFQHTGAVVVDATAAAPHDSRQQQEQQQQHNHGCAAALANDDGLRNPLEDADIFSTLFNKWGGDDAAEAAAVGSLGEFLFTDAAGGGGGGAGGPQRTATPQLLIGKSATEPQQQHQYQLPGPRQGVQQQANDVPHYNQQQQQLPPGAPAGQFEQQQPAAAAAAAYQAAALMQPGSLMVSAQSMQAMQAVLQMQMQQQLVVQPTGGAAPTGSGQQQQQQHPQMQQQQHPQMQQQQQQGQALQQPLPSYGLGGTPLSCLAPPAFPAAGAAAGPPGAHLAQGMLGVLGGLLGNNAGTTGVPDAAAPQVAAWQQLMVQQFLQQQQQQLVVGGGAFPGSLPGFGAFGASNMFGPTAAGAGGLPGLQALVNSCHTGVSGAAAGGVASAGQQLQQQHLLASCSAAAASPLLSDCAQAQQQLGCAVMPAAQAGGGGGGVGSNGAPDHAAAAAAAAHTLAGPALSSDGTLTAAAAAAAAQAAAATGNVLPALPPHLSQELMAALTNAASLQGQPGAAALAGPAAAAAAAAAGMLPGSWPLHLLGLLRPPSLQVPNVMQLAMMMQAAAQAAVLPGGGLQQTAMLVAAMQSMASSNMPSLFGAPWPGVVTPPWQQQPQPHQQQQPALHTQNNASCLGQFGQGHLMSQGTQGFGCPPHLKATVQVGSHAPQGGSHAVGSHYIGSHLQTDTTGDYSGQGGDCGAGLPAAHAGAYPAAGQWVMLNEQQQQHQQQQQWPGGVVSSYEAAAAELAAVEAVTPRHSTRQQHKGTGRRRGGGESRRTRAIARLRVKGRFVKKGTPGATVAGNDQPDGAEQQHTASDHEVMSDDGDTAEDGKHHQPELRRLMSGGPSDAPAAATPPPPLQPTDAMAVDAWGGGADGQGAAAAANAAGAAAAAADGAGVGEGAAADNRSDAVLMVSPGIAAASCWADTSAGFGSGEFAWQAQQQAGQYLSMGTATHGGALLPSAAGLAASAAAAAAAECVHGANIRRVERLYSSKRSWVTQQQLEGPVSSDPAVTPCDSGAGEHEQLGDTQLGQGRKPARQLQRFGSGLPGAAAPCASNGGGFPGLFSAPTGCLDAAAGCAGGAAGAAARDMHTNLHLCDSNRLAGGRQQQPSTAAVRQQGVVLAGSKRAFGSSLDCGPLEPSSAAALAAASRCGSLTSSQLLLSPGAAAAVYLGAPAGAAGGQQATTSVTPCDAQQGGTAATLRTQTAATGNAPACAAASAQEGTQCQAVKRQKLDDSNNTPLGAAQQPAVDGLQDASLVHPGAVMSNAGVGMGGGNTSAPAPGQLSRLAAPPLDRAEAAAQMPPPAAHPRPHSATSSAALGPLAAVVSAAAAAAAPAAAAQAWFGALAGSAAAAGASATMGPSMAATGVVGSEGVPALDIRLLLQQAQQLQLQPALASMGGLPAGAAGIGLQLQGLAAGLSGVAAHLPPLLSQQHQHQPQLGFAGLWPMAAPAALRPWGPPNVAAAVAAAANATQPLPPQAVGMLPPAGLPPSAFLASPFGPAFGLHPAAHPGVIMAAAALNGANAGPRAPTGGGGRRHQAQQGSEQADSCQLA